VNANGVVLKKPQTPKDLNIYNFGVGLKIGSHSNLVLSNLKRGEDVKKILIQHRAGGKTVEKDSKQYNVSPLAICQTSGDLIPEKAGQTPKCAGYNKNQHKAKGSSVRPQQMPLENVNLFRSVNKELLSKKNNKEAAKKIDRLMWQSVGDRPASKHWKEPN
jgi:hypothetical protein